MAGTMKVNGTEELAKALADLSDDAAEIAAAALYDGAGVVADAISSGIGSIQTERFRYATETNPRLPSPEEKAVLENAQHGIAKFDKNGSEVSTSVGFGNSGYGTLAGKTVAVAKIANAINSGTSFMRKQPFFRKAVSQARRKAQDAMQKRADTEIQKKMT